MIETVFKREEVETKISVSHSSGNILFLEKEEDADDISMHFFDSVIIKHDDKEITHTNVRATKVFFNIDEPYIVLEFVDKERLKLDKIQADLDFLMMANELE